MKGRKWSPAERRKRAHGFALARGLSAPIWTDDKEAKLVRLRENGTPYRKIATMLGVTKPAAKTRYRYIRLGRRNKRDGGPMPLPVLARPEWNAPVIYEVLALPAPRSAPDGWNDILSVPTGIWIKAREEESPLIRTVCYSPSAEQELHPWVTRDRKQRLRWDVFDAWRNEGAPPCK